MHVPAEKHTGADGLSRRPRAPKDPPFEDEEDIEDWIDTNAGFLIEATSPQTSYDSAPPLALVYNPVYDEPPDPDPLKFSSIYPPAEADRQIPRSAKAIRREAKLLIIRHFLLTLKQPPDLSDTEYHQFI